MEPHPPGRYGWLYVVDLDTDTFTIGGYKMTRTFRIDKIPVSMFTSVNHPGQFMVSAVSRSHMVDPYNFDSELVALYNRSSPQIVSFRPTLDTAYRSSSVMLRQMLIKHFLRHYSKIIEHSNANTEANTFRFRQLIYGLLSISDLSIKLSLEPVRFPVVYGRMLGEGVRAIPSWEPPDCSTYTLSSVIVVLEPRMRILECLQAAIGKAVSIAKMQPRSHTAIIASLDTVAIVYLTRTNDNITVSHTENLFFCPYHLYCSSDRIPSAGINAVLDVFASHIRSPCGLVPVPLPAELWDEIFSYSDHASRSALGRSCQFFRSLSERVPKFGCWTLDRAYHDSHRFVDNHPDNLFLTTSHYDGEKCVLVLEKNNRWTTGSNEGYQVVLYQAGQWMELELPLIVARETTSSYEPPYRPTGGAG